MIVLLQIIIAIANGVLCQDFLDYPPINYTAGESFEDCERRFPVDSTEYSVVQAVGGVRAFQGEFQYMAAIGWTRSEARIDYLCGGSLITWRFILTAAHCAVDANHIPPDTTRLGDTDLGSNEDDEFAQQVGIARIIKHPQYKESKKYYDIALIELQQQLWGNEAINLACVWREQDVPSELLEAVGFGALGFGEMLSPTLQKVKLRALDTSTCAGRIPMDRRRMPEGLRPDQLCAHSETMDTCEGDSGGPLQTELHDVFGNIYPLLVGVVSFGTPCTEGSTGVYTRVTSYLDWIVKEVNQSLSYEDCVSWGYRKQNPAISASVISNFPFQRVGLLWKEEEADIYQCGGLLIDYQYVLTSADCVTSSKGPPKFVASHPDRDRAPVEDVFVHPRFLKGKPYFDIAVIKILKYANPEQSKPVCPWNEKLYGHWAQNTLQFGATLSLFVELQSDPTLRSYIHSSLFVDRCVAGETVPENDLICIERKVSLIPGLCKVDYGGPVVTDIYMNNYKVHGILSRATQGCDSNVIFTSLAPHKQWLESIMFKKLNERLIFSD
ncbi:transmembrane protease serine 9-like [Anopheles funestus]|uniref:transmembrane protease serine 9-like n=1 Tax=Anopheles funestus TaxID=62324 RepID=UPI0020C6E128|nr:transmembrane protease serine 9-like [Anopheles funestus]